MASRTERATAICANLLVQRGELDVDAPVARYWRSSPPAATLVDRLDLGVFQAREMLEAATAPKSYLMQEQTTTLLDMSAREFRAAVLPAANGVTDARSLVRVYASLIADGVDGVRLFTDETVRLASAPQADGRDEVMGIRSRLGACFYLYMEAPHSRVRYLAFARHRLRLRPKATPTPPETTAAALYARSGVCFRRGSNMVQAGAFGHGGAGGSIGFADPKADIGSARS